MFSINEKTLKEIGARLKKLRERQSLTINDLVDKLSNECYLNVDEKTIRRYEKGESLPKLDNLVALSEIFHTTLDYLVMGKETSDDNELTWRSSFKRLNRLIFSLVLIPQVEADPDSPHFGKYYFYGGDDELKLYMDKLSNFVRTDDYKFVVRGEKPSVCLAAFDNLIGEFSNYEESLAPWEEGRFEDVNRSFGGDPEQYWKERVSYIKEKRKQNLHR